MITTLLLVFQPTAFSPGLLPAWEKDGYMGEGVGVRKGHTSNQMILGCLGK